MNFAQTAKLTMLVSALLVVSAVSALAEQFSNFALTTLASTIGGSDTTLTVSSTANFPGTAPFRLVVQDSVVSTPEIMMVTGLSGNTYTVTRGYEGSTASGHSSGSQVAQFVTAGVITDIYAKLSGIRSIASGTTDTASIADSTISWQSGAAVKSQVLPVCNSSTRGLRFDIVDGNGTASGTNPINITSPGSTLNGGSTISISNPRGALTEKCDGVSNWLTL